MSLTRTHVTAPARVIAIALPRLVTVALAAAVTVALGPVLEPVFEIAPAHAQEVPTDRFFAGKAEAETDKGEDGDGDEPDSERERNNDETRVQGSLTSTTFAYQEVGSAVRVGDNVSIDNASPVGRLFTDLRGQVDARHLAGSAFDARVDARARVSNSCTLRSQGDSLLGEATAEQLYGGLCKLQSGSFGDAEYDAREVYVKRTGDKLDLTVGRQFVLDLAATKIDGVSAAYRTSKNWSWLAFGGLYPTRGSRSIEDDYPVQEFVAQGEMDLQQRRVMPVAAGAGGAYRYQQMYGSVGVVGILPRAEEISFQPNPADPASAIPQGIGQEALRAFVTASGYWRRSTTLDLYHFAVVDFQGTGRGLTNLSAGVNYRPAPTMRVTAAINHVDTETLNVIAQEQLENPAQVGGLVQNNVDVLRIASDSARVGVSVALAERRFEVSTAAQIRQRPEIRLDVVGLDQQEVLGDARAAELLFSVVDRRSFRDWRLGALALATFPAGGENLNRTRTRLVRAFGSREIRDGRGQLDVDVTFLDNTDDDRDVQCLDLLTCFGTSKVQTIGANGTLVYRLKADWLLVGNASLARQSIETTLDGATPPNLLVSAFARFAYRF